MNYLINLNEKSIKSYHLDAIKEYEKRLSRYCKVKKTNLSDEDIKTIRGYKILICTDGQPVSSTGLAEKLNILSVSSVSNILINLKPSQSRSYDWIIKISSMRIEHGLLSVILYEQLYRGYKIISGEPYHK